MVLQRNQDNVAVRNEQFTVHYEEIHLQAWRLALYLCGRREDAEDLLAETVAGAIRNFDKLRDVSKFKGWFMKSMRNLHIDHIRRSKRQMDVADFGGDVMVWERLGRYPQIEGPQRSAEARQIFRAIDMLPESLRTPLVLNALEGLDIREIGDVMGLGQSAVKVRIHRARKKLMELLGEDFEVS
ncbi:RNA polymerase sigma factor [bacterium]|nr:RNA polymerase sigma factor [bacterium]MCB1221869.1 RNA polymerase sigma factor [bacterium]UNM09892.1 MAG: RNA polymerase sigma factor [Planctomycetales bacterium]